MVRKIITFFSREIAGLHEAAYLLGAFAVLSQLLALVRDRLFAYSFGAGRELDLYYAAFRIPDFIFASVASLVSISILIPLFIEKIDRDKGDARALISGVFSAFFFIILGVVAVAYFVTPGLLHYFFPTFANTQDFDQLVYLTRILLLSPVLFGFSNFFASITQIYKRFFIYAISPLVYNLGIIFGILVLYPIMGLPGLAWGVVIGAAMHCGIQLPFVVHKHLFPRLSFNIDFSIVKKIIFSSFPRTLTVSSNEIAEFFLVAMAASLAGGGISIFTFAWNLQSVPLSVVGMSYSLAAFPLLTRLISSGDEKKFAEHMVMLVKHIIFWSLPIMTLFIVLRAQIVRTILGAGNFNWDNTRLTAAALALFVISLIPQSLGALFVRSYYSRGNTRKPFFMNAISAASIIAFSYAFVHLFKTVPFFRYFMESLLRVMDLDNTVILMLPLGFSVGVILNLIIHWVAFERDFSGFTKSLMRPMMFARRAVQRHRAAMFRMQLSTRAAI
jgi:putative peptidoglycan lipid II flippase